MDRKEQEAILRKNLERSLKLSRMPSKIAELEFAKYNGVIRGKCKSEAGTPYKFKCDLKCTVLSVELADND